MIEKLFNRVIWMFIVFIPNAESSVNVSCDFETDLCGWSMSSLSDFDWRLGSGPTPDRTSGPNVDHTYRTESGKYLYIKSRDARLKNWTAIVTHNVTLKKAAILEFWYFMNGNGVGSLSVTQSLYDRSKVLLWTRKGRQGKQWLQAYVHLPIGSYALGFEANAVYHFGGDLAIDDIVMLDSFAPSTQLSHHEITTQQTSVSVPYSCNFEGGLCGIKSPISFISSLKWTIRSSGISYIGKYQIRGDSNTGKGNYLLIESPASGQNGDSANLELPWMETKKDSCLMMSYIMPSRRSGTISVYKKYSDIQKELLLEISGYQGTIWNLMYLTIKPSTYFKIVIKGSHTGVPHSVLGIDDIHLNTGPCKEYTTKLPGSTIPTLPQITISKQSCSRGGSHPLPELTCDFSDSLCDFNATKGLFTPSWYRTNSSKYFLSSKGITDNFIYADMDSWYVVRNRTATLSSPFLQGTNLCLYFEYYLNHISSNLVLIIENQVGLQQVIWRANFTDMKWKVESININYGEKIKILFKSRKKDSKGLVGLDNIKGFLSQDVTTKEILTTTSSSFETSTDIPTGFTEGSEETLIASLHTTSTSNFESTKSETESSYTTLNSETITASRQSSILTSVSERHKQTVSSQTTIFTDPERHKPMVSSQTTIFTDPERHKPTVSSQTTVISDPKRHKSDQTDSSYTTGVVVGVLVPTISLCAILVILILYNKKWKSRKVTEYEKPSQESKTKKGFNEQNGNVYHIEMENYSVGSFRKLTDN